MVNQELGKCRALLNFEYVYISHMIWNAINSAHASNLECNIKLSWRRSQFHRAAYAQESRDQCVSFENILPLPYIASLFRNHSHLSVHQELL